MEGTFYDEEFAMELGYMLIRLGRRSQKLDMVEAELKESKAETMRLLDESIKHSQEMSGMMLGAALKRCLVSAEGGEKDD